MKILKYNLCTLVPVTRVDPVTKVETTQIEEVLSNVTMGWNEANEEIAKKEAYNGEYTVEDDGQPAPVPTPTLESRVEVLETTTDDMILLMADLIGGE